MILDTSAQDTRLPLARPRKWIWLSAGFVAVALLTFLGGHFKDALSGGGSVNSDRLTFANVEWGELTRDVAAEGRVVAAAAPTLYAGSNGTVTLAVQPGDTVKAGQVVAQIASPELQANLAQLRSAADALKSDWLRAQADARQARAAANASVQTAALGLTSAENDLTRQTRAFEAGAAAGIAVDQARDALARARITHEQSLQALTLKDDATRFELAARRQAHERAELQVTDLQRQQLDLTVRAPVDGQIGQVFVADRSTVAKDAKLLAVIDLTKLEVQIQVAESQARELAPGMLGEISGNGQHWRGRISSVSPEVVNSEVAARLRFDGVHPEALRQNQRLSARVMLGHRERVLRVARGSFVEEGGGHWAYVVVNNVATKRPIRLGVQSLTQIEVLDGLKAGEQIVVAGADVFKGASQVQLIQ
ncbi:efflux RND transporter periplasmic adaptor subunit [Janthinobacterium fluminis]|uniref:HlyD family efflux transporter periplasmic adaptor subunit n=1 Tax=Janthinobacterium fluminis TaxID=2987524 RepID=A0ABT5JVU9_9BURK|nr:HlyD family efflux transporter periplasmic adaptor subunit [Janthinobacterium fluminis]MDC8756310.1 HlyD family efflux transporter periplasmic adaptor subunit [Janthinobacterium fluminis]